MCKFLTQLVTMLHAVMESTNSSNHLASPMQNKPRPGFADRVGDKQEPGAWSPRLVGRLLGLGDGEANMRQNNQLRVSM